MVTFNFSNVSGNPNGVRSATFTFRTETSVTPDGSVFSTFVSDTTTRTLGQNPVQFTSELPDAGLPDGTMVFTVTASSRYYAMAFIDSRDRLDLEVTGGFAGSPATYTMTFDAGSGLTKLSGVSLNIGIGASESAAYLTENGIVPVGPDPFDGEISGIRFFVTGGISLAGISGTPTCFAAGTRIATPDGVAQVQDLKRGDTVLTSTGAARPVVWVGQQSFDIVQGLPPALRLVRIAQDAFGPGLPERDLVLTADHALAFEDVLINAGALVNGTTVTYEDPTALGASCTLYHVETEDHVILLAEGVPAESFADARQRKDFDNYADYRAQVGPDRIVPALPLPRITSARHVPACLHERLMPVGAA